jgi:hypothetical protein
MCFTVCVVKFVSRCSYVIHERRITSDDITLKDSNGVAVSSGSRGDLCITIIDIKSQKVMTTIPIETYIFGMAIRGRTMYYCTRDNGLKILNLSDQSVSDIITSNTPMMLSIWGNNHNIVRPMADDIHVPIIVYRDTTWTF